MLNSINSSMAYTSQEILKPKKNSEAPSAASSEAKTSSLSPKAAAIAEQIANGTYKIDLKASANALLNEFC